MQKMIINIRDEQKEKLEHYVSVAQQTISDVTLNDDVGMALYDFFENDEKINDWAKQEGEK